MTDSHEPRPEIEQFLRDQASAMEHDAAPVNPSDVTQRVVPHSLEPRRWVRTPAAVAHGARRQPAIAAAVIAALLIGSLGGFAVGRGSAPKAHQLAAARGASDGGTTTTTVTFAQADAVSSGGFAPEYRPPTMQRLFIRTGADGVVLRGYVASYGGQMYEKAGCDANNWCPPPECVSSDQFLGELSNDAAVGQTGAGPMPLHAPAELRSQLFFGEPEGAQVTGWVIEANDTITNVRATWPDGFVDEMAPQQGWAMVAHTGSDVPSTVVATASDGSTTALEQIPPYPAECTPPPPPPPSLPSPGSEQPDDVQAAKDGVTQVYETVYTHGFESPGDGTYVEDGTYLATLGAQVKQNYPEATDTITVEVGDIVFLSKTEAALYFELKYSGGALFGKQIGYAKLIDGSWKIARDTMCMVYSWGGVQCDPPPDPARSSGYGNAPSSAPSSGPATATTTPN